MLRHCGEVWDFAHPSCHSLVWRVFSRASISLWSLSCKATLKTWPKSSRERENKHNVTANETERWSFYFTFFTPLSRWVWLPSILTLIAAAFLSLLWNLLVNLATFLSFLIFFLFVMLFCQLMSFFCSFHFPTYRHPSTKTTQLKGFVCDLHGKHLNQLCSFAKQGFHQKKNYWNQCPLTCSSLYTCCTNSSLGGVSKG